MDTAAILTFGSLPGKGNAATSLRRQAYDFPSIGYLLNVRSLINCKWSAFEFHCTPINFPTKELEIKATDLLNFHYGMY